MPLDVDLPFDYTPRWYQEPCWNLALRAGTEFADPDNDIRSFFCLDHRRAGKDLNWFNIMQCKIGQRIGIYAHIFPTLVEGRRVIWNGMDYDGRRFLDYIPGHRDYVNKKRGGWVRRKRDDEMSIEFANGSIYIILGGDHPDSIRGMNVVFALFSEWAFFKGPEMLDIIRPMLRQNGGIQTFITTPDGKNHSHALHMMAKKNPKWYEETLTASYTKAVAPEMIQSDRDDGMSEERIASEYECSYELPVEGSYFGKELMLMESEGRIGKVPYEPTAPVDTYWDIGRGDATAIWFAQQFGRRHHLIGFLWMTGEGLPEAIALVNKVAMERNFVLGEHFGPHDMKVRDWSIDHSKTRTQVAAGLGYKFTVMPKRGINEGINAVRVLLATTWIDEENCQYGLDGLRSYRRKKAEGGLLGPHGETLWGTDPEHGWASHPADSLRSGAMGRRAEFRVGDSAPQAPKIAMV